jgi:preprotein translocase subunit YajC
MMPTLTDLTSWIVFAQDKGADKAADQNGGVAWLFQNPLLLIGVLGLLFYMMLIRPERKKRAQMLDMMANIKKNDKVVTIGGIYGTVVNAQKDSAEVTIRVDDNTRLRMRRSAIASVVNDKDKDAGENMASPSS